MLFPVKNEDLRLCSKFKIQELNIRPFHVKLFDYLRIVPHSEVQYLTLSPLFNFCRYYLFYCIYDILMLQNY